MNETQERRYARGTVAVVGCGWLGFALAQNLLTAGYTVLGTTTRPSRLDQLKAAGIRGEVLRLSPKRGLAVANARGGAPKARAAEAAAGARTGNGYGDAGSDEEIDAAGVWRADQLVLNVPPGRTAESRAAYPGQILSAVLAYRRARSAGRIIFCSSTSVYGDLAGEIDEDTPLTSATPRALCMALAESQVRVQSQRPNTVLRLGGLYGGNRHPGKTLAGRTDIPNGDAPTNLVSRDRVIARIRHWLDAPMWPDAGPIENVVDGQHPSKRTLYGDYAEAHGLDVPTFLPGGADGKLVRTRIR